MKNYTIKLRQCVEKRVINIACETAFFVRNNVKTDTSIFENEENLDKKIGVNGVG